jgi:hypothetical protein
VLFRNIQPGSPYHDDAILALAGRNREFGLEYFKIYQEKMKPEEKTQALACAVENMHINKPNP